VSYSHTVNVASSLGNHDVLKDQLYAGEQWEQTVCYEYYSRRRWRTDYCTTNTYNDEDDAPSRGYRNQSSTRRTYTYDPQYKYPGDVTVKINDTKWSNTNGFRSTSEGCIEERSSVGQPGSPVTILQTVSQADIDETASNNGNSAAYQWGRYDPDSQNGQSQNGCPSQSQKLKTYASETAFQNAVNAATANVTGGTYHDIGMLWGARFLSPTGMFASENPTQHGIVPVNRHIVFMTDGKLDTGDTLYSAFGVDRYHNRIQGSQSQTTKHINRFDSICDRVKSTGTTIWVIALDVTDTDDIEDCATTSDHFYTSDGSDLESIFERIGRGIGNLRLTR